MDIVNHLSTIIDTVGDICQHFQNLVNYFFQPMSVALPQPLVNTDIFNRVINYFGDPSLFAFMFTVGLTAFITFSLVKWAVDIF